MCVECWTEYGSPRIDGAAVAEAVDAVRALYDVAPTGGAMHVVTDDWNLDSVDWCLENIDAYSANPEEAALARRVGELFSALSEAERASVLAKYWGHDQ
jgi:hypothetical protein